MLREYLNKTRFYKITYGTHTRNNSSTTDGLETGLLILPPGNYSLI